MEQPAQRPGAAVWPAPDERQVVATRADGRPLLRLLDGGETPGAVTLPESEPAAPVAAAAIDPWSAPPRRVAIERVPVDPDSLTDEAPTDWFRHEVRRSVVLRLVATGAGVAAATAPPLWWRSDDPLAATGGAMVIGSAVAGLRWCLASWTSPLGRRAARRSLGQPPQFVVASRAPAPRPPGPPSVRLLADPWEGDPAGDAALAVDLAPDPETSLDVGGPDRTGSLRDAPSTAATAATAALAALGFRPAATMRSIGDGTRIVDLRVDGDVTVAAVDRASGATTLYTELSGARVLVTSSLLVLPGDDLVVNVVPGAHPTTLVVAHRRLVAQAFRCRVVGSDPVGLFRLAHLREAEAARALGPRWAALVDLRCRPPGRRLLAAPAPADILSVTGNRLYRKPSGLAG
jgi:hypothetical protein